MRAYHALGDGHGPMLNHQRRRTSDLTKENKNNKKKTIAPRGDRTPDLLLTKQLPCHLAIEAPMAWVTEFHCVEEQLWPSG